VFRRFFMRNDMPQLFLTGLVVAALILLIRLSLLKISWCLYSCSVLLTIIIMLIFIFFRGKDD